MHRHILIPTDGSQLSTSALDKALAFAKDIGARVTILTVVEPFHVFSTDAIQLEATREQYENYSRKVAEDILDAAHAKARQRGVDCSGVQAISDEPAMVIVDTAEQSGCDLIAMASRGREGFTAFMLGSVTMKVLAHSKTPVLVYR
jgi:nucleotide-binding universal stress UspA family protein